MRLSKYPFPDGLRGMSGNNPTTQLLHGGLVASLVYPGVPLYTPIGARVLDKIERRTEAIFADAGFEFTRLPGLVKTSDLDEGEKIGETFAAKFLHLQEPAAGFHMLTTPEMMVIRAVAHGPLSYAQLPLRLCYTADFFREANVRSLLVCRQFRIFGALSLEADEASCARCVALIRDRLECLLAELGIPIEIEAASDEAFECFFPSDEGDYAADRPLTTGDKRRRLSLGMAYRYGRECKLPVRIRTSDNRKTAAHVVTFGLCTNRLLFAVFDAARNARGFSLPPVVRPFDVAVIPRTAHEQESAVRVIDAFKSVQAQLVVDDRFKETRKEREAFCTAIGVPVLLRVEQDGIFLGSVNSGFIRVTIDQALSSPLWRR